MSADNYYEIRAVTRFVAVMCFASDDTPAPIKDGQPTFTTLEEALASIAAEPTEYGSRVTPEAAAAAQRTPVDSPERAAITNVLDYLAGVHAARNVDLADLEYVESLLAEA